MVELLIEFDLLLHLHLHKALSNKPALFESTDVNTYEKGNMKY